MSYPGGKGGSGVVQQIINQIPPHTVYIEPFLGHGSVLRAKRPAVASIGIDSDAAVIDQWRSCIAKNDGAAGKNPLDDIAINYEASWQIPGATVICGDAITYLTEYQWSGNEFVYCDPPYLFEVRSSGRKIYNAEFGDIGQHEKLLRVLSSLPCPVAISGYWSELYAEMLATWRAVSFQTVARSGKPKTEFLWMNYPQPEALHDYRYLGSNFRERERLTRIRRRWVARIQRMDHLERLMLAAAIAENGVPVRINS